ncbi:ankyrin repeat domain-containing protein [Candidatus Dependentiae bacterium]|nr:ankyrin repeat domain-containing protein [Candidatus Dependentiae bacterium]
MEGRKPSPGKEEVEETVPVTEKKEPFPFEKLLQDIKAEILKFIPGIDKSNLESLIKSLIQSYKNFINLKFVNSKLYHFLNTIVDKKNNITRYQSWILNQLSEEDFKNLNQYIYDELEKKQLPRNLILLIQLLKTLGKFDANLKDNSEDTALMRASWKGHTDIAKLLINSGADVNAKDKAGNTALGYAIGKRHKDIVKLLIKAKADLNAVRYHPTKWPALAWVSYQGDEDMVKLLISLATKYTSWDVNETDSNGQTALMKAVIAGQPKIVKLLIKAKADINIEDNGGNTALDLAKQLHQMDIIELLESQINLENLPQL